MFPRLVRGRNIKPERDCVAGKDRKDPDAAISDVEDIDLIQRLQNGDHDALTALFEKYSRYVFGIARRLLRDDGEAEEVVQQVFLDIYRAIDQFDDTKASYKTWLFQFAYHRTINRRKHLAAKRFYAKEELDAKEELGEQVLFFPGAERALQLSSQEVVHLIEQLLKSIKPKQREAITLTFFQGYTAEEIAHKTGESAAAVRHNLYRGLDKLRTILLQNEVDPRKAEIKSKLKGIFFAPARLL